MSSDFAHCPGCFAISFRDRRVRHRVRCAFDGTTREDWTQQRIADALGVSQHIVSADLAGVITADDTGGRLPAKKQPPTNRELGYRALAAAILRTKA